MAEPSQRVVAGTSRSCDGGKSAAHIMASTSWSRLSLSALASREARVRPPHRGC